MLKWLKNLFFPPPSYYEKKDVKCTQHRFGSWKGSAMGLLQERWCKKCNLKQTRIT